MINRSHVVVAAVALLVGVAAALLWRHDADKTRDGRIITLDSLRRQDSIAHVAAIRKADSTVKAVSQASATAGRIDTLWRTTTKTVTNTVKEIVNNPNTTAEEKIPQLVAQITRLTVVGDSLADATTILNQRIRDDSTARVAEREAAAKELRTARQEIDLLKKQSRHWGLGAALGPGVSVQEGNEVKVSKAQLTFGVVFRW